MLRVFFRVFIPVESKVLLARESLVEPRDFISLSEFEFELVSFRFYFETSDVFFMRGECDDYIYISDEIYLTISICFSMSTNDISC